jgi:hypothetical protein
MSSSAPKRPLSYRRRARLWMLGGAAAFALLTVVVFLTRPREEAYVPGREAETSDAITRSLDRELPPELAEPAVPAAAVEGAGAATPAAAAGSQRGVGGVVFTDSAAAAGVDFVHFRGRRSSQLPEDMGSGLAWGDYDGDGDPDLYVVNQAGPLTLSEEEAERSPARARLFRNDGDGTFTDVTDAAGVGVGGWGMGAAWGDYDGDGDLDLFVTRYGTNLLFRNEGEGRFADVSKETGVGGPSGFWAGVSWADYDRDGDLDAYVCGYVRYTWEPDKVGQTSHQFQAVVPYTLNPSSYPPIENLLLRNDGGVFTDVAREAGVGNASGRSLSASWCDFDGDGWPDLYVANDVSDNAMYHNLGDGTFGDISHSAWVADYRGAMGLGIGDWDRDGDFDMFITHWLAQEHGLYADESRSMKVTPDAPLRFVDQADLFGVGQIGLDTIGWGTGFFDFDNDGRLDVYAVNGSTFQEESDPTLLVPMRSFLFWNAGDNGYFEVGERVGGPFCEKLVGRGASPADYDGDGDLDLAVLVHGARLRLARNDGGNRHGWARVVLRSLPDAGHHGSETTRQSTSFATGARVTLEAGGATQIREVGGQSSYLSHEPPGEVFFGVGDAERIDRLEVRWPSGRVQSLEGLPARATIRITEGGNPEVQEMR